jgi:hypothetical protein
MTRHPQHVFSVPGEAQPHARMPLFRGLLCFSVLMLITISSGPLGRCAGNAAVAGNANPAIIAQCKADLAQRCKVPVKEITVAETRATTWPDTALGMPAMGKIYAQVLTPGWKVILEARRSHYLYTASSKTFQYGGPVPIWAASMLYLLPAPNEPNLNGDLYQCSLLGTNHRRLASGVTAYYPQENGGVLITRRLSRASHALLAINAKRVGESTPLHTAFAFGAAALNSAHEAWAAFVRPQVGGAWTIMTARIGQEDAQRQTLPLPEGTHPGRIAWSGKKLLVLHQTGERMTCFETLPTAEKPEWKPVAASTFPGLKSYSLNKSEMLEVNEMKTDGQPSVEVARVWFTGDRNVIATISGLTLRGHDLPTLWGGDFQQTRYLFIWGDKEARSAAYTVDIATGEVLPGYSGGGQDIQPFACALPSAP